MDALAMAKRHCITGTWYVPECWCFEYLPFHEPTLKDTSHDFFPRPRRWLCGNYERCKPICLISELRELVNWLSRSDVSWSP